MKIALHPKLSKEELLQEGLTRCLAFLDAHNLRKPHHIFTDVKSANKYSRGYLRQKWCGAQLYENSEYSVAINLKNCRVATRVPGWSWTYPGYKVDLTPFGVICHEFGHHIDAVLGFSNEVSSLREWKKVVDHEEEVSGYEPNYQEAWAEAFRLFIANPSLLKAGRPERWEYFTEKIGLVPPHASPWKYVLKHAHPKILSAAKNWISNS